MSVELYAKREPVLPGTLTPPTTPVDLPQDVRLGLYETVWRLRHFEQRAHDLFLRGLVKGTTHLSIGMEATAAGFGRAMRTDDYTFATYRGHAHTLARNVAMADVMGELLGRATGLLGGKGGSMHLTSVDDGVLGSYAIIGAHLPIACGAAWSAQLRGSGQVAVCFFGDGTTNIGAFHEALNLAAIWNLPVVFVCENNLYMEYTPIAEVTAVVHPAADRAQAYGLDAHIIDGNDVDAVFDFASGALAKARSGAGPTLVEAVTYRHGGHSRADAGKYRPEAEVDAWMAYDPVEISHRRLLESGVPEAQLGELSRIVVDEVEAAVSAAIAAPEPDLASAMSNLWADGTSSWRR